MHLFVDISCHGFGHLAITAPVLDALAERVPELHLTLRTGLPEAKLRQRIRAPFVLMPGATDFGYVMHDALTVDRNASAATYREAHADWSRRVAAEAECLRNLRPDLVLSNVSYLPLAGARAAGIPSVALCSLNWADLFTHFFGNEPWAPPIHRQIAAAYASADCFLRTTPAMPMADLPNTRTVGPIAARGRRHGLDLPPGQKTVLLAHGGIAHHLPVDDWPRLPGVRWLVPGAWQCRHPDAIAAESFALSFTDLLASVDAVITKPGYGTFTEAAVNGVPVLYQRRADWPEQDCLVTWLHANARCLEVDDASLQAGRLDEVLERLWALPPKPPVLPDGADEAGEALLALGYSR